MAAHTASIFRRTLAASFFLISLFANSQAALAAGNESRIFTANVDGRPSGTFRIDFHVNANGSETITSSAQVTVRVLLATYRYTHQSKETWLNNSLWTLAATTNDNGKKSEVRAQRTEGGLVVTVGDRSHFCRNAVLTSTGCRMPFVINKTANLVVLETEDGSETNVNIQSLGPCSVQLKGQTIHGQRYRLTGKDTNGEWWFDQQGRAIRQSMLWDGHRVVLELAAINRP